jgi:hypothetical protein
MAILPKVKLKAIVAFPADVEVESPLTLVKDGLTYRFGLDPDQGAVGPTGAGYGGTSGTSLAIDLGSKSFETQTGYAYQPGNYIRASSAADGTNYMEGTIVSYTLTTMVINVTKIGGSGTKADWTFSLAGTPGATGSGSGDMLAANNLSDVINKKTAKDNISVHGADVASATTTNLETATGDLVDVTGDHAQRGARADGQVHRHSNPDARRLACSTRFREYHDSGRRLRSVPRVCGWCRPVRVL